MVKDTFGLQQGAALWCRGSAGAKKFLGSADCVKFVCVGIGSSFPMTLMDKQYKWIDG